MRILRAVLVAVIGAGVPSVPSVAFAADPPNVLFAGTTARGVNYSPTGWCSVDAGVSSFQRNGAGPAFMSFEDVTHYNGAYFTLAGAAKLIFGSANKGRAYFDYVGDYPSGIRKPRFTKYKQTYDATTHQVVVTMKLRIGDCDLPVQAVYRN